ncbi:hypothetical protein Tco_1127292 [Tanacetum coccineum]
MIESFSSSPIPVKDSDSLMEDIDIFLAVEDLIPPGIDSEGYDSEEDNPFLEYEPDPGELTRVVDNLLVIIKKTETKQNDKMEHGNGKGLSNFQGKSKHVKVRVNS